MKMMLVSLITLILIGANCYGYETNQSVHPDDKSYEVNKYLGTAIGGVYTTDQVQSGDFGVFAIDADRNLQTAVVSSAGQYAEDSAHTTADIGSLSLAVRNDTLATLGDTDGDYVPFQVNGDGALYIQEGSALDVSAATVTVDGTVNVDVNAGSSIVNGQTNVATAGTAVVLGSDTAILSVTIRANHANTNMIYAGNSSVDSSNGFVLDAGETMSIDTDNLNDIYIDADTNGEGVSYFALVE